MDEFLWSRSQYHLARKNFVYKGLMPDRDRGDERGRTGGHVEFTAGQDAGWHDDGQPARDDSCGRASMRAEILDGRAMSEEIKAEVRRYVEKQG